MAFCKILALVLLAGTACMARPNRIVGGEVTTIENYPSMVQIDSLGIFSGAWSQSCAATILNTLYEVSAAHCFDGWSYTGPSSRRIRAGTTDRNSGGVIAYISEVFNHPSYGSAGFDGDISVFRLTSPLTLGATIAPVAIISQGFEVPDNAPVVHAGWGTTAQGGSPSPVLRDVTIYTVNRQLCAQRYGGSSVSVNMICAGLLDVGGADACQGDSGGPLYYGGVLVGIVSWGQGCAQAYYPGVSTRVSSYTDWIVSTAV